MKSYEPQKLMAISRYQDYFPTLSPEIQKDVYTRIGELIGEEKEYCDKGNYKHMAQILTSIALYGVLQRHGTSEEILAVPSRRRCGRFLIPPGCRKWRKRASSFRS